jgi:ABC-type dipeptide/oligopeptide/nickel transport system permease subunit
MALAIFAEAALSFLGLGIQPPEATLGNVLAEASPYMLTGAWWFSVLPGVLLTLIIVGLNLVGDGLSDALDPDLRV